MLKKLLLSVTFLLPVTAIAQTTGSGSAGGLNYLTLTSPGGCSTANPCQIVAYLHYLGGEGATSSDIRKYFDTPSFWSANPHAIIVAPLVNGSSASNSWGGVTGGVSPNMQAAVAAVKQIEATVPTMTNNVVLTGGSMGGIGTETGLTQFGPKGVVEAGVFNSGISYDGNIYDPALQQAAATALCGINFTMVHGTADQSVPYSVDKALADKLSGCPGFKFVPIAGAGHGTWNNPAWQGYGNGDVLLNQTIDAAQAGAGAPTVSAATTASNTPATAPTASPQVSTATTPTSAPDATQGTEAIQSATIAPGSGSITDADGNVWTIVANGSIRKGDVWVAGGGGTSQLQIGSDGKVYGLDSHGRGWFLLSGDQQSWASTPPPSSLTSTTTAATDTAQPVASTAAPTITQTTCTGGTGANATGKFYVSGGQFIGPNGMPFIGRGVNIDYSQIDPALNVFSKGWTGINIVRIPVASLSTGAETFRPAITALTSKGIVALLEFHPWVNGSGPPAIVNADAEAQWVGSIAKAYAGNTFVWVASQNEPNGGDISAEHAAIYKAVRAADPDKIILLSLYGGGVPTTLGRNGVLNASTYTGMRNIGFDNHVYNWAYGFSQDQAAIEAGIAKNVALIQQITSADGIVPVILGEYGNGVIEDKLDPGGMATVYAVLNVGSSGKWGSMAWRWQSGSIALSLINADNSPSDPYGQAVSLFIGKSQMPCTEEENTVNASSAVEQVTQVAANDNTPTTSSLPTVADAQAAARTLAAAR